MNMLDLDRVRELMDDDVEQVGHADVSRRRAAQNRNHFAGVDAFVQAAHHLIVRQLFAVQKLFNQFVVAFGRGFDQQFAILLRFFHDSRAGSPNTRHLCRFR